MRIEKVTTEITIFEVNDFVEYYQGQGETGYGTIIETYEDTKTVSIFDHNMKCLNTVGIGDIKSISTEEEAAKYAKERMK